MENGRTLWFVLGVLAVWRMTHLLHLERGPWGVIGDPAGPPTGTALVAHSLHEVTERTDEIWAEHA